MSLAARLYIHRSCPSKSNRLCLHRVWYCTRPSASLMFHRSLRLFRGYNTITAGSRFRYDRGIARYSFISILRITVRLVIASMYKPVCITASLSLFLRLPQFFHIIFIHPIRLQHWISPHGSDNMEMRWEFEFPTFFTA